MNKFIGLTKKTIRYIKIPVLIYCSFLILGIIAGIFFLKPEISKKICDLRSESLSNFKSIFINNAIIILTVYVSAIFTRKYAYFVYFVNGIVQGIIVGWIVTNNINLLWLIVPHGIFEIPCFILTGVIVYKGEQFIRNNPKMFFKYLLIHELCILICALIESFITPIFQIYI